MMAVFDPINMSASMVSVIVAGWLASTVLRDYHGSFSAYIWDGSTSSSRWPVC